MDIDEKTARRLKADQERWRQYQFERIKALGIIPVFMVNSEHVVVTDSKPYDKRHEPDVLLAEWTAKVVGDQVVVTRVEYGYLPLEKK